MLCTVISDPCSSSSNGAPSPRSRHTPHRPISLRMRCRHPRRLRAAIRRSIACTPNRGQQCPTGMRLFQSCLRRSGGTSYSPYQTLLAHSSNLSFPTSMHQSDTHLRMDRGCLSRTGTRKRKGARSRCSTSCSRLRIPRTSTLSTCNNSHRTIRSIPGCSGHRISRKCKRSRRACGSTRMSS